MELSSLLAGVMVDSAWIDEMLVWVVATGAGVAGLYAVVNALDMLYDTEAS